MKHQYLLGAIMTMASSSSLALESFVGKVTVVEPSYLPGVVVFQMDTGNVTCPAGAWLKWQNSEPQNNKAIYATLLTALIAGKQVRFHIDDGDTTCTGKHLHALS